MERSIRDSFQGTIRQAQPSDIEAIIAIEEESFAPEERYEKKLLNTFLSASLKSQGVVMLIATPDSETKSPAGYVLAEIEYNGSGESFGVADGSGEIISLAVAKTHEGHGLGRALLERVSKSLQEAGADRLVLQVRVDNASAIHLYESVGFVKERLLTKFYEDQDGFEMVKPVEKKTAAPRRISAPRQAVPA